MAVGMTASRTASFGKRGPAPVRVAAPVSPPRPVEEKPARPQAVAPPGFFARTASHIPWFSLVLSYLLFTGFKAQLARATDWIGPNAPGHFSLLAMGASSRAQVQGHGEWWRLFTQSALHGSWDHLTGNILSLLIVGFLLEPMIGIGWFAAIYFTGGFAGALVSTLLNPADALSVGASGAVMATVAALFTLSFHAGATRPIRMRWFACTTLFPALMPAVVQGGGFVDINAHLGGSLAGALVGFVILAFWSEEDQKPPGRSIAAMIAGCWVAMTVWAFTASSITYVHYAKKGFDFIPDREVPRDIEAMKADSFSLVTKYPKDPRAHLFRGLYFLAQNDGSDAEPYFRAAQRLEDKSAVMTKGYSEWSKALLAVSVYSQGRKDEAKATAAPLCAAGGIDTHTRDILDTATLCR
jgi:rhomboid protease GluP